MKQRRESTPRAPQRMLWKSKWVLGAYYLQNTLNQRIGLCGILELNVTLQNNTVHGLHFKNKERIERLNDVVTVTQIVALSPDWPLWCYLSLFLG